MKPMRLPAGPGLNGRTRPTAIAIGQIALFDGIVSAHMVSVGELVGASSPTQLATIVQLDPSYVNFNVNEQDVLRIRCWTGSYPQSG
jgi:multidrug efflux pump subunit AcrA (membrane-fusion protein)